MTTVLAVDDEAPLRQALERILGNHGYRVLVAASAEEAVDLIKRERPDVMLTDLRMEGAGGIELISATRELAPEVKAVLMSACASAADYERATDLGAVAVLIKPFTPEQVIAAVRQAVDCSEGLRGTVHGLSLVDLLQMFHFGRRTIALRMSGPPIAEIALHEGDIVYARHGEETGPAALRNMMTVSTGSIRTFVPPPDIEPNVAQSFQALLMDALREADEVGASEQPAARGELDGAFDEWASLRPGALSDERLRMLRAVLERVAPQLGAAIIDEAEQRVISIRELPPDPAWLSIVRGLDADLGAITNEDGFELFELAGRDLAVAIIRKRSDAYALALDAPLFGRLAMHRFRSQVRQVLACLANP